MVGRNFQRGQRFTTPPHPLTPMFIMANYFCNKFICSTGNDPKTGLRLVPTHLVQTRLVRRRRPQGGGVAPDRPDGRHAQLHNCSDDWGMACSKRVAKNPGCFRSILSLGYDPYLPCISMCSYLYGFKANDRRELLKRCLKSN